MDIVNRVARSGIVVYDLEKLWDGSPVRVLDIAPFLDQGLLVREKLFRKRAGAFDWAQFEGAHVAVHCSTDALIPSWAWMLVISRLTAAKSVELGSAEDVVRSWFAQALAKEEWFRFRGRIVVVKGCGAAIVPDSAYAGAMTRLMPVARKVMYGEPCSNIPIWRQHAD
ncbi:MAG: DUF2480 family protein [Bacteroidota bacterium]|nr:DUF2480 family protein [Bacteroidota bacterium]